MTDAEYITITVTLSDREDGGLRVSSEDLPGLILSGRDKQAVVASIVPAMTELLRALGLEHFKIHLSKPLSDVLREKNPQDLDMHVQRFVVEYAKAA